MVMMRAANRIEAKANSMVKARTKFIPNPTSPDEIYTRAQLHFIVRGIRGYENSPHKTRGGSDSTMRQLFPELAVWAGIR